MYFDEKKVKNTIERIKPEREVNEFIPTKLMLKQENAPEEYYLDSIYRIMSKSIYIKYPSR